MMSYSRTSTAFGFGHPSGGGVGGDAEADDDRLRRRRQHHVALADVAGGGVEDVDFDLSGAEALKGIDDRLE